MRVLAVGGGTAGHVAPLLAALERLAVQRPEVEIHVAALAADLDGPLLRAVPYAVHAVRSGKLHRQPTLRQVGETARLLAGFSDADRLLRQLRPDVLFAKGGYVSLPLALLAARRGVPVVSHETDAVPGLSNRRIGRLARTVCTAYPVEAYAASLPGAALRYTGQPVRAAFREPAALPAALAGRALLPGLPVVTAVCGSQGSRTVNSILRQAWPALLERYQLVHGAGPSEWEALQSAAALLEPRLRERLHVLPFIGAELPALFQRSAAVLSRSGGTVFELAAARAAAVLVPLPTAAQDHQNANAAAFSGAAVLLPQSRMDAGSLLAALDLAAGDGGLRIRIGAYDRPDAAAQVARAVSDALPS